MFIEPKFLEKTVGKLPKGVIFVSGSNGKSTTTALVTGVLRSQGLRVFSNPSGGNLPQGIASAVIGVASLQGRISDDVAVLEVDEAYGIVLGEYLTPNWVVLTNIQIDQLNRFFEPERVYGMLLAAAKLASRGIVINGSDQNLVALATELARPENTFQVVLGPKASSKWPPGALAAPRFEQTKPKGDLKTIIEVINEEAGLAQFGHKNQSYSLTLPGVGLHFALDTALALTVALETLGDSFDWLRAQEQLGIQRTVYGRGEVATYKGIEIEILMMKNPSSLRATLLAMANPATGVWIAMDEGTPDPSWIYDVDISKLKKIELVSGSRCWHWATRLSYCDMAPTKVVPDSKEALEYYVDYLKREKLRGTLVTNYEQMMAIRKHMGFLDLETGK